MTKTKNKKILKTKIIGLTLVTLMILSMAAIFFKSLNNQEELTIEPVLNKSKMMMEMEYYYYDLDELIAYADEMNHSDDQINESFLNQCIEDGECKILLKGGLPIN